ncbi:hypothetical protein SDC9_58937 [bioreactor metagenome]|uniref:NAD-specific glutamate dehydrogenase n=1 Tax=bioreactor metagenome TaxID=1076179 RepID=A0A644XEJ0_9ZZZZ
MQIRSVKCTSVNFALWGSLLGVQGLQLYQLLVAGLGGLLAPGEQFARAVGELAGQAGVPGLAHQEVLISAGGLLGIQRKLGAFDRGIEAEQVPVAALHGLLHLHLRVGHAALDGVHLAGGVADDQGRAGIGLGLLNGLEGLGKVGAHGHLGHVHIAVAHGNLGQRLFLDLLAGGGELGHLTDAGGLGGLTAGVGIHLGIEDEYVHVVAGGQNVVQAAEADVIGPAVAAENPGGFLGEILALGQNLGGQRAGLAVAALGARGLKLLHVGQKLRLIASQLFLARGAFGKGHALVRGQDAAFQRGNILLRRFGAGGAVAHRVQPALGCGLQGGQGVFHGNEGLGLFLQAVADGVLTQIHAKAKLRVVLEQGVCPRGAAALLVHAVRRGGGGTAPDGRAAGGVGNIHPVAVQLGDKTGIAGFGAAGAGAGEFQQRLAELAALDGVVLHVLFNGHLGDAVIKDLLLRGLLLLRNHAQRTGGALLHANAAAHAVQRGDGNGKLVNALALADLHVGHFHGGGSGCGLLLRQSEGTDGGVGADIGALVALDALHQIPGGNADGYAALLVSGGAQLKLAVHMRQEGGDGQAVAVHLAHGPQNILHLLDKRGRALGPSGLRGLRCVLPVGGDVKLLIGGGAHVDGLVVHIHHVLPLLEVGMGGGVLHIAHGLVSGQNLCKREEGGLKDGVGALAHADLGRQVDGVDGVDLNVVLGDIALGGGVQLLGQLLVAPLAVDEEGAAGLHVPHDGEALGDIGRNVAGHKVGLVDIVGAANGLVAEAQVADGHAAGLLGVVLEVGLNIFIGVITDDFDGVFVGAHGTVAAKAPELALDGTGRGGGGDLLLGQAEVRDVIHDADGELTAGLRLAELLIHGKNAAGRRILAAKAIAAADDGGLTAGVCKRGDNIEVQRLALRAGLLGAVRNSDLLSRGGDGGQHLLGGKGTIQADLQKTDLLAVCVHVVDDLLGHVTDGTHGNDDAVGVGGAVIVKELVIGAQLLVDLIHVLLHHGGQSVIVLIAGLTVLEEDISVFVGAAHVGTLGVQRVLAERVHGVHVAHFFQVLVVPHGNLLNLMGGAESVKEVHEGNAALNSGQMGHRAEVHDLLHVALAQQGKAAGAAGHHVGMVTENVQRMGGHRTGGNMEHSGQQFAGHLVHVGDHQQQTLRSGVSGGQGAGGQRTVDGAGGARLGLHLAHLHLGAENVLLAGGGPLVHQIRHGRGRGNRIDSRHFGIRVADVCSGVVTVHGLEFSCHKLTS